MMWGMLAFLLLVGCVPLAQYQAIEKKLSAALAERNETTKNLAVCEERNKNLKETLRLKPEKVPVEKIGQGELDEIKKKALYETEQKYKARINK